MLGLVPGLRPKPCHAFYLDSAAPAESGDPPYDCGFRLGIEGTGPDGETLQVLTGEPTEFLIEGESMLVAVEGISPQDCPDGTEPYDPNTRMDVSAINTALLVRD